MTRGIRQCTLHEKAKAGRLEVLTWRRTQDQRDDGVPGDLDVLYRSKDMHMPDPAESTSNKLYTSALAFRFSDTRMVDPRIGQDDPRPARVLDRKLGLAVLPSDTTDRSGQVVPVQCLYVLDLERVEVEVLETKDGDGVLNRGVHHWTFSYVCG
jgi:hypothetical protein